MRRKFGKVTLSAVLSLAMSFCMPGSLIAAWAESASDEGANAQENEAVQIAEGASYAEGQVLVEYAAKASGGISALSTDSSKEAAAEAKLESSSMEVEELWDFGPSQGLSAQSQDSSSSASTEVALVSSDTLSTEEMLQELASNSNVKNVSPNYKRSAFDVSDEEYGAYQWNLSNTGQNAGTAGVSTNVESIWDEGTTGTDKVIAIIDTGVDYTNAQLKGNMWNNPYKGRLAGAHGYNAVDYNGDPMDDNGHGTHVAGIIGAACDGTGTVGVAQNIKIMALKFLDAEGYGYDAGAIACYNYIYRAMKLGVDVVAINNSWGGSGGDSVFTDLINVLGKAGAISVCAAGNSGTDMDAYSGDAFEEDPKEYPAACSSDYCVSVAAVAEDGSLATFSNYGQESVDIAAPGTNILSTVSYDCFNPSIYTKEQRDSLAECYTGFEESDSWLGSDLTDVQAWLNGEEVTGAQMAQYVSFASETYYGSSSSGRSLKIGGMLEAGDELTVAIPYTQTKKDENSVLSLLCSFFQRNATADAAIGVIMADMPADEAINEDSLYDYSFVDGLTGEDASWNHVTAQRSVKAGERKLVIVISNEGDENEQGKAVMGTYLDDLACSNPAADNEDFGTYDLYSGTSQATPCVSAAIALIEAGLRAKGESTSPEDIIGTLYSYETKTAELAGKTVTGGYLDFAQFNPTPIVNSASVDAKTGAVTLKGARLGDASSTTVYAKEYKASDEQYKKVEVSSVSADGKELVLKGSELVNCLADFKVVTSLGTAYKSKVYLVSGKQSFDETSVSFSSMSSCFENTCTDGTKVYGADSNGFYYYDPAADENDTVAFIDDFKTLFSSEDLTGYESRTFEVDDPVYLDGSLYAVATVKDSVSGDEGFGVTKAGFDESAYYSQSILVKANADDMCGEVVKAADIPSDIQSLLGVSLASYNGKLYLLGGYDRDAQALSCKVWAFNASTKTWTEVPSMALPQGRAYGSVLQSGNSLVYTLGVGSANECPKNLVFNGSSWSVSKAEIPVFDLVEIEDGSVSLYGATCNVGLCKGGIQYVGLPAQGLGDTFKYSIAQDKMVADEVQFSTTLDSSISSAFVFGDTIYVVDNAGTAYTAQTTSGLVEVSAAVSAKGTVSGANIAYAPGMLITLKASPSKKYYAKSMTVAGTTVKRSGTSKLKLSLRITSDVKATVTWGRYVTKITPKHKTVKVKAGSKTKLKYTVGPKSATNKAVSFTSSNTKWATVSSKGVVKAKAAGKGKTVTITIKAKDGSKKKAKVKVRILK